jgi:hypothetical protein
MKCAVSTASRGKRASESLKQNLLDGFLRINMHNKRLFIVILPLILIAVSAGPIRGPIAVPSAKAQLMGVVCIAPQGTSTSGCPGSPISFSFQGVGSRLIIAVNIQGSDALNGFRIFLKTDNTVLNPVKVDINNTLLGQPVLVLANCVNGAGTGCSLASGDGPGVVDVGAVSLAGLSTPPTTGGLFEIIYNVISLAPTTISWVTGCIGTSVTGLCITITNGGSTPDLEATQVGSYSYGGDLAPTISAPLSVTAPIGVLTTFTVTGSDPSSSPPLTLTASGLPSGATFTTSGTNPVTGIFSWTPTTGSQTVTVTFTATNSFGFTASATTTLTVPPPAVQLGKVSWTHHLSLAKNANMQTWNAKITNPGTETAYAIGTIQGTNGVLSFTAHSAIITLVGGAALEISITQTFDTTSVGTKYHFTTTMMWGLTPTTIFVFSLLNKSGAFTVVS